MVYKQRFVIKRKQGIELLLVDNIYQFKLVIDGLYAYDSNNKAYPLSESSLSKIEAQINPQQFFRINRTEIISISAIKTVSAYDKDRLQIALISDSTAVICSAQKTPVFRQWLDV